MISRCRLNSAFSTRPYPHWGNCGGIPNSAILDGDWKLIRYYWQKEAELFNLASDPGERGNLAKQEPEKLLQPFDDGILSYGWKRSTTTMTEPANESNAIRICPDCGYRRP